jgi:hypothetical protein
MERAYGADFAHPSAYVVGGFAGNCGSKLHQSVKLNMKCFIRCRRYVCESTYVFLIFVLLACSNRQVATSATDQR